MIIRGGENIYPKEIEEVMYRHPAVLDCAIVGFPDKVSILYLFFDLYIFWFFVFYSLTFYLKIWGEQVAAVVVVKEGKTMTPEEVISYLH